MFADFSLFYSEQMLIATAERFFALLEDYEVNSYKTKKHRPRGNRNVRKNSVLSAPSGARTLDTLIKSQVLYQLS